MAGKNKFTSLRQIRGWTCEDVQRALSKNDLKQCCPAIAKRNIDGEALLNLTEGKLALWKQDLKNIDIQKLSTFVVNINLYPEKYSSNADVLRLAGNVPAKTWGQDASQSSSSSNYTRPGLTKTSPTPPSKPMAGLRSTGSSNGFNNPNTSAPNKFNKPVPPVNADKPTPPSNFNKPAVPNSFNKPGPPSRFNKPVPPNNFNKPAPPNNFSKPTPPINFNKSPSSNSFNSPNPPSNFNKSPSSNSFNGPNPPSNFNKPNPPNNASKPVPNNSRLFSTASNTRLMPAQSQADQGPPSNEYLPMGRKSPLPPPTAPVLLPTNRFTRPVPEAPRETFPPPPASPANEYPLSDDEEDDEQPEYLNVDEPAKFRAYPPEDQDDRLSDAESWHTDFDDADEDDFDYPAPPEVPSGNKSSLFGNSGVPSLPQRPPNREPDLPARPFFQPPSAFGYPQPPAALDGNVLNDLIGQDMPEYSGDDEYSFIDEFTNQPPPPLGAREYPSKPAPAPMQVPEAMAPSVPHREPVVIFPRNLPSPFGGGRMPEMPKLPPREPYLNRFPKFPDSQGRDDRFPPPPAEDDAEYEVIEHREGEEDYLAPTPIKHAASTESVGSASLPDKLREALAVRKISLNTPTRPETPPMPFEYTRDKTPTLESKPFSKPPPVDRQFSNSQPQRPLPPPPEPVRRPSGGGAGAGGSQSMKNKQWYLDVDRRRGEDMIRNGENGAFLLRPSARTENPLTLTVWYDGRIYNIGVRLRKDQRYALGSEKAMERSFGSVDELVSFYQRESLMLYSGGEKMGSTLLTETPGRRYLSH